MIYKEKEILNIIKKFKGEEYTDKEIWEEMKQKLLTSISGLKYTRR